MLAVIIAVPLMAAMAWTRHADAIKAVNTATRWLTSTQQAEWYYGTLHQRMLLSNWSRIVDRVTTQLTGFPGWLLPLSALVGLRTRAARFWTALAAVPLLTILAFFNLYVAHDYYLAAISPVPAALAGFGFARLWHAFVPTKGPRFLVTALVAWMSALLLLEPSMWTLGYRERPVSDRYPEVAEVSRLTMPTDLIAFDGYTWTPEVPYYSRRIGRLIGWEPSEPPTSADLARDGYRVLVTRRLKSDLAADTIRVGRWTGVLGRFVFITGDTREDLRGAPVGATDEEIGSGSNLLTEPVTVLCGAEGAALLPRAPGGTVLHLAPGTPRTAKLSVASGFGDVPARASIVLGAGVGEGPVAVKCRDADAVTIMAVTGS